MPDSTRGNVAGNPVNDAEQKQVHTRSSFPQPYKLFNTERFAEYTPFFVTENVRSDKFGLLSSQQVDSYTLKSPLLQTISRKKDLYLVPMESILPRNWEKFYTNPVVGDDVPDDCGCGVEGFWSIVNSKFSNYFGAVSNSVTSDWDQDTLLTFFQMHVVGEYFFSNGSLMSTLGIHGAKFGRFIEGDGTPMSFDLWFDCVIGRAIQAGLIINYQTSYNNSRILNFGTAPASEIRDFLESLRDDPVHVSLTLPNGSNVDAFASYIIEDLTEAGIYFETITQSNLEDADLNIARLAAYQIVCRHFYSNDHVDYVYSANLYRELMDQYSLDYVITTDRKFTVNGLDYLYDPLSGHICKKFLESIPDAFSSADDFTTSTGSYLAYLFSFRRSLRFVDYFTGARTRPLAVGDTKVDVQSGSPNFVNVIDVTQNIQRQRFFNAVNRFGRKFSKYLEGLIPGQSVAPDWHNPFYIGHTTDFVFGDRNEYTGLASSAQQQNITSVLRSSGGRYQFNWETDRDCIAIGIAYYDIERVYSRTIERQALHMNRFDMFNPFMQFIGDQSIYSEELGLWSGIDPKDPFGYTLRHMEYKQRYSQCAGGFVENLPSWVFINDLTRRDDATNVSPSFIRSFNTELDRFYVSLTGFSLGSYWHFIVENTNEVSASRPMAYAPSIL